MRRNLFLYLALACFVGLLVIFVVDGYLGVYDTVYVTAGEESWKVEANVWLSQFPYQRIAPQAVPASGPSTAPYPGTAETEKNAYYMSANRGEEVSFRYEVDNRLFSTYKADIEVSVWHSQQKVSELLVPQPVSIAAFDKGKWEWVVDNAELLPRDILPEQGYDYTVIITRGEIERRIVVSVNPLVSK